MQSELVLDNRRAGIIKIILERYIGIILNNI
jgi:hypothetical protein